MREFKNILLKLRKDRHVTQEQLADALHITKQALSHYERGTRYPKKETLEAIADYFNVDMNYLTGRSNTTTIITPAPAAGSTLSKDQEELLCKYDSLNDEGKAKVLDYTSDLVAGGRYEKVSDEQSTVSGTGA